MGHFFGFGSVEEDLTREVLGFEGRDGEGHFDHSTGEGRTVPHKYGCKGSYSDARDTKNNSVNLLISNSAGAINWTGIRYLHQLDKKSRRPGAHDDTAYDLDHRSHISYFTHHLIGVGVACIRAQAWVMQALSAAVRRRAAQSQRELAAQYARPADDVRAVPAK